MEKRRQGHNQGDDADQISGRSDEAPTSPGEAHDSHGTPFERVPGPGPKDQGKGAAGRDAIERIERNH